MNHMNFQDQLFDSGNLFLPNPINGETLYNWCVRFHRLSTNTNPRLTSRQLFNDSAAGFRHDFPTHIYSLSENTNQLFGSVENLIYDKTIFPIFAPFLTTPAIEAVIQDMQKGGYSRVKNYLGLRSACISTVAPLKACPNCMRDDKISSGMAWWHVDHQLPTVRICPKHGDYLLMATQEFHSRGLNDWYFPPDLPPSSWHDLPDLDEPAITRLRSLCDWSLRLVKYYDRPFDHELLRLTYHLRAKSLGWTTIDGTLKFAQVRLAFRDVYKCLENFPGFSFIRETVHDHGGFIGAILLKIGVNKHPLRHVIMMEFLFGDPDIFIAEYERVLSASTTLDKKSLWTELTDSRSPLKLLVANAGYSANAAARQLDIPLSQAISFLRKEGIEYKQRHRIIDQQKEEDLIELLMAGEECNGIVSRLAIKKSFIFAYLAKNPELRKLRRNALQKRLVEDHRANFLQFLADNSGLSIQKMRTLPESGFQWLKLNDKTWLKQNLPGIWQMPSKE
jgi:hypothetical protein